MTQKYVIIIFLKWKQWNTYPFLYDRNTAMQIGGAPFTSWYFCTHDLMTSNKSFPTLTYHWSGRTLDATTAWIVFPFSSTSLMIAITITASIMYLVDWSWYSELHNDSFFCVSNPNLVCYCCQKMPINDELHTTLVWIQYRINVKGNFFSSSHTHSISHIWTNFLETTVNSAFKQKSISNTSYNKMSLSQPNQCINKTVSEMIPNKNIHTKKLILNKILLSEQKLLYAFI